MAVVKELLQPFCRADTEVMATFGTNLQIVFDGFAPDDLPAGFTLLPQALSFDVFLKVFGWFAFERRLLASEPSHGISH